jgi:hypothetical protein
MAIGIAEIPFLLKVKSFFGKLFSSPWFYAILAFAAIAVGTGWYLKNDKAEAVEQATEQAFEQAGQEATVKSLEAQTTTQERTQTIDRDFTDLREQTTEDFTNVRNKIDTAPVEARDAPAPRLLIDTLNELDRLRQERSRAAEDRVPDAKNSSG